MTSLVSQLPRTHLLFFRPLTPTHTPSPSIYNEAVGTPVSEPTDFASLSASTLSSVGGPWGSSGWGSASSMPVRQPKVSVAGEEEPITSIPISKPLVSPASAAVETAAASGSSLASPATPIYDETSKGIFSPTSYFLSAFLLSSSRTCSVNSRTTSCELSLWRRACFSWRTWERTRTRTRTHG